MVPNGDIHVGNSVNDFTSTDHAAQFKLSLIHCLNLHVLH